MPDQPTPEAHVDPTRAAFEAFKALPRDTPIHMLNLVRFRDCATYPADHPAAVENLTGAEAYALYGVGAAPVVARLGARIHWRGRMEAMLIGPAEETWDACFIAAYPNSGAFLAMVTDPEYQKAVVHRQAAVATSRLIRLAPLEALDTFG
jgi:uncharacterized protein (DUF1330 family)